MNVKEPLFSVIITCYNYQSYVANSIESVLKQNCRNFELIVVNDGSTDGSWDVISRYSDVLTAINTENRGFIAACLTGLSASHGTFILFLDADDLISDTALGEVAERITPEVSKIQFQLQPVDAQGNFLGDPVPRCGLGFDNRKMIDSINRLGFYPTPPTSGNIYRREIYLSVGAIDYDFGIDGVAYLYAPFRGDVVHIEKPLGYYRIHNNNMSGFGSGSASKMERERVVFLKRLAHLDRLLAQHPRSDGTAFALKDDYLYSTERQVFTAVLNGRRPDLETLRRYLEQVSTSLSGIRRLSYLLFGLLLFAMPAPFARRLLDFNINPRRHSKLRLWAKRLMRG